MPLRASGALCNRTRHQPTKVPGGSLADPSCEFFSWAESGETAEEIAPRSTRLLAAIQSKLRQTHRRLLEPSILLFIAPNCPIVADLANSDQFYSIPHHRVRHFTI